MKKLNYSKKFYAQQRASNLSSAQIIVPIVLEILEENNNRDTFSVIDLGCGSGNWLSVFKTYGCKVLGVDGGRWEILRDILMIDKSEFVSHDFRKRYRDTNRYSLAISLECAEHIPEENAEEFISTLTDLSDVVLFSGAIPFQRGKGHINEQYPSYWIQKFDEHGYKVFDIIRGKVWNNKSVRGFYAQNIFLYIKKDSESYEKLKNLVKINNPSMYDVIHPDIWEQVNQFKVIRIMDKLHNNKLISWIYYTFLKRK